MPAKVDFDVACRQLLHAIRSTPSFSELFRQAAPLFHKLTDCDSTTLTLTFDNSFANGYSADFRKAPQFIELPAAEEQPPEARLALETGQPQWGDDTAARPTLYLPLVSHAKTVGVLQLCGCERAAQSSQQLLQELGELFGLAVANLSAQARVEQLQRFCNESAFLRDTLRTDRDLRSLTGESRAMKAVRQAIQQVARTDSTVLILGETGTGKELVARAIHQLSARRDRLLVAVNCAALAPGIIASELFGHEQGAFTGANRRRLGRFELAQGGTVFLDEVGELPLETQVLLLRVLQERSFERVGGHESIAADVRVIAATHRDLHEAQAAGRFRADLFYRLNVFPIRVPPLRERPEDNPDLARHFLRRFARRMGKPLTELSPATQQLLMAYHWPGNVRELENLIERAVIVSERDPLHIDPSWLRPTPVADHRTATFADAERRTILAALERCQGRIYGPAGAAAALGLKPTTLYGKMRRLGIARPAKQS